MGGDQGLPETAVEHNFGKSIKQSPKNGPFGMQAQADATRSARSNNSNNAHEAYRGNRYGTEEVLNRNYEGQDPVKLEEILEGTSISRREVTTLGLKARK